jgi:hypothetical protein
MAQSRLTADLARQFARATLGHVGREYPHKLDHVMAGPEDVQSPRALHPIFFGSYDWHSCVHGWWQLLTLARLYPETDEAAAIRARADAAFTPDNVAGELAYLARPGSASFERPYGWAWLLALHAEAGRHGADWAAHLEPLARAFADRFKAFLPRSTYPVRVGTHFNFAFALILARGWAEAHDPDLLALIDACAHRWFGQDRACQAWEPGGDEFLSPALTEALLMQRVLPAPEFAAWFDAFLPEIPETLLTPAIVSDRSDGKIVHLDGLNLSRAWCWRGIADALGDAHPTSAVAKDAAERHIAASLPHVTGDYMGEHWLASFALLALLALMSSS